MRILGGDPISVEAKGHPAGEVNSRYGPSRQVLGRHNHQIAFVARRIENER